MTIDSILADATDVRLVAFERDTDGNECRIDDPIDPDEHDVAGYWLFATTHPDPTGELDVVDIATFEQSSHALHVARYFLALLGNHPLLQHITFHDETTIRRAAP